MPGRDDAVPRGRAKPVLALAALALICAELLGGDVPMSPLGAAVLVGLLPIYGAGVVLVRELVRRRHRGWPSILLLGAAYGLIEEGLGLQSLFNPDIYGAIGRWGARFGGINGVYTEVQLVNHAVWSIAVPILLMELLFPAWRNKPLLRTRGLVVAGVVYVLGVLLVLLSAQSSIAPGYWAPPLYLGLTGAAAVALAWLALVLPTTKVVRRRAGRVPAPLQVALTAAVGSFVYLGVLVLPGHAQAAFMQGPLVALPMFAAICSLAVSARLAWKWASSEGWNDLHSLAVAGGALAGHGTVGGLALTKTLPDRVGLTMMCLLMAVLLLVFGRRNLSGALSRTPTSRG